LFLKIVKHGLMDVTVVIKLETITKQHVLKEPVWSIDLKTLDVLLGKSREDLLQPSPILPKQNTLHQTTKHKKAKKLSHKRNRDITNDVWNSQC